MAALRRHLVCAFLILSSVFHPPLVTAKEKEQKEEQKKEQKEEQGSCMWTVVKYGGLGEC